MKVSSMFCLLTCILLSCLNIRYINYFLYVFFIYASRFVYQLITPFLQIQEKASISTYTKAVLLTIPWTMMFIWLHTLYEQLLFEFCHDELTLPLNCLDLKNWMLWQNSEKTEVAVIGPAKVNSHAMYQPRLEQPH